MSNHWLFVDGSPAFGGHEVMLLRWLEELRLQHRVVPIALARADSRLRDEVSWCAASEDLPSVHSEMPGWMPRKLKPLWRAYRDALTLRRVLKRLGPAICIVAEGCLLSQPVFAMVARWMKVRTVIYVPLTEPATSMGFGKGKARDRITRRFYAKLPQAWLTITAEQAIQLRDWAVVTAPIFNLPNAVTKNVEQAALQLWKEGPAAIRYLRSDTDAVRVLVLGRLDAYHKGLDLLVDYLERATSVPCKVHVDIVGEGPYDDELRLRLKASAKLRGLLSLRAWGKPVELMKEHDVLLLASRFEGVPLVMLEAMALGVPVVASDLPGTRAMLPAESLFPVGNLQRAFDIIHSLNEPDARTAMVMRNREKFLAGASGSAFSSAVVSLTDQLLGFARYGDLLGDAPVLSAEIVGRNR